MRKRRTNTAALSHKPGESQANSDKIKHAQKEAQLLQQYEDAKAKRMDCESSRGGNQDDLASLKQAEDRCLDLLENSRFTSSEMRHEERLNSWRAAGRKKQDLQDLIGQTRNEIRRRESEAANSNDPKQKQWHSRHKMHEEQMLASFESLLSEAIT